MFYDNSLPFVPGVFTVSLTLNRFHTLFKCFHCWLSISNANWDSVSFNLALVLFQLTYLRVSAVLTRVVTVSITP